MVYATFQLCLILGAPWGHFTWGGAHEVLPASLRIGSAVSILVYLISMALILSRAGVKKIIRNKKIAYFGTWILTIYLFLGVLMNVVSRSHLERYNAPFILLLAILLLIVAKSKRIES